MEGTCTGAHSQVQKALKDAPFAFGPWGEQLSLMKGIFLESTVPQAVSENQAMTPLQNEATIPLDWSLSLSAKAQEMLFTRIRLHFERATAIVDEVSEKRRYRMCDDDIVALRNLLCLWTQVADFLSSRMDGFEAFQEALRNGSTVDAEFHDVMLHRPSVFALSFLPRAQVAAMDEVKKHEEVVSMEAQRQRLEVREARWKYFASALERDQETLRQVQDAPQEAVHHSSPEADGLQNGAGEGGRAHHQGVHGPVLALRTCGEDGAWAAEVE